MLIKFACHHLKCIGVAHVCVLVSNALATTTLVSIIEAKCSLSEQASDWTFAMVATGDELKLSIDFSFVSRHESAQTHLSKQRTRRK